MKVMMKAALLAASFALCSTQAMAETTDACKKAESAQKIVTSFAKLAEENIDKVSAAFLENLDENNRPALMCKLKAAKEGYTKTLKDIETVEKWRKDAELKNAACTDIVMNRSNGLKLAVVEGKMKREQIHTNEVLDQLAAMHDHYQPTIAEFGACKN